MKRSIILVLITMIMCLTLTACKEKQEEISDALKFKEEYESLNGTKTDSGKTIRTITIDKDNPIIYKKSKDIVSMVKNKETFVVYFGFASCPWCRSVLPNLIKAAKTLGIDKIYYVDVLTIRDTLKIDENGEIVTEKKGTQGYYDLLKTFDSVLEEYTLKNSNGETIKTNEKRIYAPNIISVTNGKIQGLVTGISEAQTDGYMELTPEMLEESYNLIKCNIQCVADEKNICSSNTMC